MPGTSNESFASRQPERDELRTGARMRDAGIELNARDRLRLPEDRQTIY
jgi:hypothetical protein